MRIVCGVVAIASLGIFVSRSMAADLLKNQQPYGSQLQLAQAEVPPSHQTAQATNPPVGKPPAELAPQPLEMAPPPRDPMEGMEKRVGILEEWKAKVEKLPILSNKVNLGLNALQFQYAHQNAEVPEGKSQDNFLIRRSELLAYGKISEHLPKWHVLFEFQSIGLTPNTPGCPSGGNCAVASTGTPSATNFFRESYIDYRPVLSWAPNLNFIRMGVFRMPWGIFTETSGGLRDIISSPYLTSVGSGNGDATGTAGTIEFLQERDLFVDVRGTLFNRLEYASGIMNNNNYHGQQFGANGPKVFYSRLRFMVTDISWVSFNVLAGESNNTNTAINGRGKGEFDRFGIDARYASKIIPGFKIQAEAWQGHDGANQTTVGRPAQGACLDRTICGGSGAPGQQRRTWYVMATYLFSSGILKDWEPVVFYEQFDPSTSTSNDMYTRTIVGLTYYFQNLPPKIQSKVQLNYEFRHHQGTGPGTTVPSTDQFAQNAFYLQWQIRYQ